MGEINVVT